MECNKGCPNTDCNNWVMTDSDNCYHCGCYDSQAKIKALEQQLTEANEIIKDHAQREGFMKTVCSAKASDYCQKYNL